MDVVDKLIALAFVCTIVLVFFMTGYRIGRNSVWVEAVEKGKARYNPKNGEEEWIEDV